MSNLSTFMAYAAAFEQTFADDNWQRLEQFFAEDATYEVTGIPGGGIMHGRDAIFRGIKKSLDGFDRRMASRQIVPTAPPAEDGNRVTLKGLVRYVRDGAPVEMHATIVVEFTGGLITRMHDAFVLDAAALAWFQQHGRDVDGAYV
jgi:ketosteroid isomerase-like protein